MGEIEKDWPDIISIENCYPLWERYQKDWTDIYNLYIITFVGRDIWVCELDAQLAFYENYSFFF